MKQERILIIRFSSLGDVLQTLSVASALKKRFPQAKIHFCTRNDFAPLCENHPNINKIWTVNRNGHFSELLSLARELRYVKFSHIYDAHSSLRSRLFCFLMRGPFGLWSLRGQFFIRRTKYRFKRVLLFNFGINLYPKPFVGQTSLLEPLKMWQVESKVPEIPQLFLPPKAQELSKVKIYEMKKRGPLIALSPSASFELKRWPLSHFKELVSASPSNWNFAILGGPDDHYLGDLFSVAPERMINFVGRLSYVESAAVVLSCDLLISSDTGLMHAAEQLGKPCVSLMGPAPFGYPGRKSTKILELDLPCRPCSKHGEKPCKNKEPQKCLVDIRPDFVLSVVKKILSKE